MKQCIAIRARSGEERITIHLLTLLDGSGR